MTPQQPGGAVRLERALFRWHATKKFDAWAYGYPAGTKAGGDPALTARFAALATTGLAMTMTKFALIVMLNVYTLAALLTITWSAYGVHMLYPVVLGMEVRGLNGSINRDLYPVDLWEAANLPQAWRPITPGDSLGLDPIRESVIDAQHTVAFVVEWLGRIYAVIVNTVSLLTGLLIPPGEYFAAPIIANVRIFITATATQPSIAHAGSGLVLALTMIASTALDAGTKVCETLYAVMQARPLVTSAVDRRLLSTDTAEFSKSEAHQQRDVIDAVLNVLALFIELQILWTSLWLQMLLPVVYVLLVVALPVIVELVGVSMALLSTFVSIVTSPALMRIFTTFSRLLEGVLPALMKFICLYVTIAGGVACIMTQLYLVVFMNLFTKIIAGCACTLLTIARCDLTKIIQGKADTCGGYNFKADPPCKGHVANLTMVSRRLLFGGNPSHSHEAGFVSARGSGLPPAEEETGNAIRAALHSPSRRCGPSGSLGGARCRSAAEETAREVLQRKRSAVREGLRAYGARRARQSAMSRRGFWDDVADAGKQIGQAALGCLNSLSDPCACGRKYVNPMCWIDELTNALSQISQIFTHGFWTDKVYGIIKNIACPSNTASDFLYIEGIGCLLAPTTDLATHLIAEAGRTLSGATSSLLQNARQIMMDMFALMGLNSVNIFGGEGLAVARCQACYHAYAGNAGPQGIYKGILAGFDLGTCFQTFGQAGRCGASLGTFAELLSPRNIENLMELLTSVPEVIPAMLSIAISFAENVVDNMGSAVGGGKFMSLFGDLANVAIIVFQGVVRSADAFALNVAAIAVSIAPELDKTALGSRRLEEMAYVNHSSVQSYAPLTLDDCESWTSRGDSPENSAAGKGCTVEYPNCTGAGDSTANGRSDCKYSEGTLVAEAASWKMDRSYAQQTTRGQFESDTASGYMGTPSGKRVDEITRRMNALPRVGKTGSLRNWPPGPTPSNRRTMVTNAPPFVSGADHEQEGREASIAVQGARARHAMLSVLTHGWEALRGRRALHDFPQNLTQNQSTGGADCVFDSTDPWRCCDYAAHPSQCCQGHPLCVQPVDTTPFRIDELPRNFTSNETLWWYCPAMRDAGNLFLYPLRKLAKTHGPLRSDTDEVRPPILRFLFDFPLEHDYAFPTQDVACYALNVGALTPWFWLVVSLGFFWLCAEDYVSAWLHWAADARDAVLWHANPDLRRVDADTVVDPDESDESSQGTEEVTESTLTSERSTGSDSLADEAGTFSIDGITKTEWDESTDGDSTTTESSLYLNPSADGESDSEDSEDSEDGVRGSDSALGPLSFVSGERHPRLSHPREALPVLLL